MMDWLTRALPWIHPPDRMLAAYADKELGAWATSAVGRHLRSCTRCREAMEVNAEVSRTLESAAFDQNEQMLAQMLEEGRTRLWQAMGGVPETINPVVRREASAAEIIFGCRNPGDSSWEEDMTLASMYSTLLGSKVGGARSDR